MDTERVKDVGIMPRKVWNPYADIGTMPYVIPSRHYVKPTIIRKQPKERYNAEADLNQTARTVVGGAVVIGTLGLLGSMFQK